MTFLLPFLTALGGIGWHNGFTDPSYLARAFRRAYGVSPGEHRRATVGHRLPMRFSP